MKPYTICHMIESLDGRIDCDMTEKIEQGNEYYEALDQLDCDSMLSGRVTSAMHYATGAFTSKGQSVGHTAWHKALEGVGFYVIADTRGSLCYDVAMIDNMNLLILTSEKATDDYLDYLKSNEISYIAVGKDSIDLPQAMEMLAEHFGVERLAVCGGGHINGSFLREGLLNEISMQIAPGIDGREGMAASFDGGAVTVEPSLLSLKSVERMGDTIWMRYTVKLINLRT